MTSCLDPSSLSALIQLALAEDVGSGDVTSRALFSAEQKCRALLLAKEGMVVCGQEVAQAVFHKVDSNLAYLSRIKDGGVVKKGDIIGEVSGSVISIFTAERVVLNFLQRLSGIATLTKKIVDLVAKSKVRVLDTRKTTPGWRKLEKYAVSVGGGVNHRFGLYDAMMIKSNHLDVRQGTIQEAIGCARQSSPPGMKVEVEVRTLDELKDALAADPDTVMLDNMSIEQVVQAVSIVRSAQSRHIEIEVSGGITEKNITDYASKGIDCISLGMLTHSVRAADISLRVVKE